MDRLEEIVARLPEAERVDIAEWGRPLTIGLLRFTVPGAAN